MSDILHTRCRRLHAVTELNTGPLARGRKQLRLCLCLKQIKLHSMRCLHLVLHVLPFACLDQAEQEEGN